VFRRKTAKSPAEKSDCSNKGSKASGGPGGVGKESFSVKGGGGKCYPL